MPLKKAVLILAVVLCSAVSIFTQISPRRQRVIAYCKQESIFLPYPGFEENYWFQEERLLFDFSMEIGDYLNDSLLHSISDTEHNNHIRNSF